MNSISNNMINKDNIGQNVLKQLQQSLSSTSDVQNQEMLNQALTEAGLPQNKLNDIIQLTRDHIMCDSNCQKDRKAQELRNKFYNAEQNLCKAPEEVIDAEKNFYVYTKGEQGYEDILLKRFGEEAGNMKNKSIESHKQSVKLLDLLINDYETDTTNLGRINELLKIRLKENEKLKKIIDGKTGTAQTNDRKVVYESREKEWLETVRKSLIYLLILIVVLYLIFGNFFKKQHYKSIKIWIIIAAFIIYVLGINIMSRITFWITGKINYFYNNKAPRNVYINL